MCSGTRSVVVISSTEVGREVPILWVDEGCDRVTLLVHRDHMTEEGARLLTATLEAIGRLRQPRSVGAALAS